jgi:glycosyltransferase involved in cell wall biosynthesis
LHSFMRILHVTDGSIYNYDGVSTYINELLECASKEGAELLVLTTVPLNPENIRHVLHKAAVKEFKKIKFLSSLKFNFSLAKGMKHALDEFKPDILWIHTIGPLGLHAAILAKNKYHIIYTKHCFYGELWINHLRVPVGFRWMFNMVARAAERKILKSSKIALYHNNDIGTIHHYKYLTQFKQVPPPLSEKFLTENSNRTGNKTDTITIGYCGRLDPEKRLEHLFNAADIFQKKFKMKKIRILLIGAGAEAEKLVKKYPHINTTITGFVDDVIPYLDLLDAFVLASGTETTSIASLEAYSLGLPVFSTPVGFLGQNTNKFPHAYNFNTPEELAGLIYKVLVEKKSQENQISVRINPLVITYSKLHEIVTNSCL